MGRLRTVYHRQGNKPVEKSIVGLCQGQKTAFEHVLLLLKPQNTLGLKDLSFLLISMSGSKDRMHNIKMQM